MLSVNRLIPYEENPRNEIEGLTSGNITHCIPQTLSLAWHERINKEGDELYLVLFEGVKYLRVQTYASSITGTQSRPDP